VKQLRALLVNPYIYDFAAYNFWSAPLGLLYMASLLREKGVEVRLIDCLRVVEEKRKADGRAPFIKEKVEKPPGLRDIRRTLRRYGISRETLMEELAAVDPPDLALVTSIMTYWYGGTQEAVDCLKEVFPEVPVVVGGIYPSLCNEHARQHLDKADLVVANGETARFSAFLEDRFGMTVPMGPSGADLNGLPYPAFDLYGEPPFVPLLTSLGCVFRCAYCATSFMYPTISRRDPGRVIEELIYWQGRGVERFVLYDDNFLYESDRHAKPLLRAIASLPSGVDIYNPNALNAAFIDEEAALLLREANFKEVRLGLETTDRQMQVATGGKVNLKQFEQALAALTTAGFPPDAIHVYILAGLPLQRWEAVKDAVDYLLPFGVTVDIAEYTPIPHTKLFDDFHRQARYPIAEEPLFQNNVLFPFAWEGFTEERLEELKHRARGA
jgi:radical SAM superfamily enzyme YgiQ (UPF0313 family)